MSFTDVTDFISQLVIYGPYVIAACAAAMAALPQGVPGSKWDKVRTFVNYLAMNWGNAKNVVQK